MRGLRRALFCGLTLGLSLAATPTAAQRPHWFGFRGNLGVEAPRGDPDSVFQGNIRGEFSVQVVPLWAFGFQKLYAGLGYSWVSFPIEPDKELEDEQWNYVGAHALLGYAVPLSTPAGAVNRAQLALEGRFIERRIRPIDFRFWEVTSDQYRLFRPCPPWKCYGFEGVVGLELPISLGSTYVDVSGRAARLVESLGEKCTLKLSSQGLWDIHPGWALGLQLGLVWFP